jgi:CheY-like chemotaxis protein
MPLRILVVDDEPEIGSVIKLVAEASGHSVEATTDPNVFMAAYLKSQYDLLFLDVAIPECDGLELMDFLASHGCKTPVVVMSGSGDYFLEIGATFAKLHHLNVLKFMRKPFRTLELTQLLGSVAASAPHSRVRM